MNATHEFLVKLDRIRVRWIRKALNDKELDLKSPN